MTCKKSGIEGTGDSLCGVSIGKKEELSERRDRRCVVRDLKEDGEKEKREVEKCPR